MKPRARSASRLAVTAAIAGVALAGCGRLNRAATINQVTTTSGAAVATVLAHQLAAHHALTGAQVSCSKTVIVNVGVNALCHVSGAGHSKLVRFTFSSKSGRISATSVKTQ
jgi:hypothetical protein